VHSRESQDRLLYRERLTPPLWLWICTALLVLSLVPVLIVVIHPLAVLVVIAVIGAAAAAGLVKTTPTIALSAGELRAGRARIPLTALGRAVALTTGQARTLRGPEIEPRAYHLIRGWIEAAVVVEIRDPGDPTPYWYVSTRRPAELSAAITRAVAGAPR
jgi:hypothetical protein